MKPKDFDPNYGYSQLPPEPPMVDNGGGGAMINYIDLNGVLITAPNDAVSSPTPVVPINTVSDGSFNPGPIKPVLGGPGYIAFTDNQIKPVRGNNPPTKQEAAGTNIGDILIQVGEVIKGNGGTSTVIKTPEQIAAEKAEADKKAKRKRTIAIVVVILVVTVLGFVSFKK